MSWPIRSSTLSPNCRSVGSIAFAAWPTLTSRNTSWLSDCLRAHRVDVEADGAILLDLRPLQPRKFQSKRAMTLITSNLLKMDSATQTQTADFRWDYLTFWAKKRSALWSLIPLIRHRIGLFAT